MNLERLYRGTILIVCLSFLTGCSSFGKNTIIYLSDREKVYIVKANSDIPVVWANESITIRTDQDMVLLDKGSYLRLEKEANQSTITRK